MTMAELPAPELQAPPVVLRRFRGHELSALFDAVSTSVDHLRPWMPWASADPLRPALAQFIAHAVEAFDKGEGFAYALWDDQASTIVGGAGLHPRPGPGRIEIGYWVRLGWLRRGIASAVSTVLASAAFALSGIEEVHIRCDAANFASAAVPRRLGFRLAQTVDHEIHAPGEIGRSMEWVVSRPDWVARSQVASGCSGDGGFR